MKSQLLVTIPTAAKTLIVLVLILGSQAVYANWKFNSFTRLVHPLIKAPSLARPALVETSRADAKANVMMESFRKTFLTHNGEDIRTNAACYGCDNRAAIMSAALIRENKTFDDSSSKYNVKGYVQAWTADVPYVNFGEWKFIWWKYHVVPVMVYGGQIYVVETLSPHDSGFIKIRDWSSAMRSDSQSEKLLYKLVGLDQDPSLEGNRKSAYQHTLATLIDEIKSKPAYPDNYLSSPEGKALVNLVDSVSPRIYYESRQVSGAPTYFEALYEQPSLRETLRGRIAEDHPQWSWTSDAGAPVCSRPNIP